MGSHLIDGQFQSDKYPTTPRGKVPLSVGDVTAQDLLWEYAQRRRSVDAEFADDLETALRAAGHVPDGEIAADVDPASLLSWITSALQGHATVSGVSLEPTNFGSCVWVGIHPKAWSWFFNTVVATGNFPTGESALVPRAWHLLRSFMDRPFLRAGSYAHKTLRAYVEGNAALLGDLPMNWILPGHRSDATCVGVRCQEAASIYESPCEHCYHTRGAHRLDAACAECGCPAFSPRGP